MSEENVTVYSDSIKQAIENLPEKYLKMSEEQLRKESKPNVNLHQIKNAFWNEMTDAQKSGRNMIMANVYRHVFSKTYFYNMIKDHPVKLAWITSPLVRYEQETQALLDTAMKRFPELIGMGITTTKKIKYKGEDGVEHEKIIEETDASKAKVLLSVIQELQDRVKGTAITRQLNVSAKEPKDETAQLDMAAVNREIQKLQKQLGEGSEDVTNEVEPVRSGVAADSDNEGSRPVERLSSEGSSPKLEGSGDGEVVNVERDDYREV